MTLHDDIIVSTGGSHASDFVTTKSAQESSAKSLVRGAGERAAMAMSEIVAESSDDPVSGMAKGVDEAAGAISLVKSSNITGSTASGVRTGIAGAIGIAGGLTSQDEDIDPVGDGISTLQTARKIKSKYARYKQKLQKNANAHSKSVQTERHENLYRSPKSAHSRVKKGVHTRSGNKIVNGYKAVTSHHKGGLQALQSKKVQATSRKLIVERVAGHTVGATKVVSTTASAATTVSTAATTASSSGVAAATAAGSSMAVPIGLIVALLIPVLLIAAIVTSLGRPATLNGVEGEVQSYLQTKGFNNTAIAAVLGNMRAESNLNPASDEIMDGQFNHAYERACGLLQYTSTQPGSGEYDLFKAWCTETGRTWSDVSSQMEWTFGSGAGLWTYRWSTNLAASGYYSNCPGYPGQFCSADEFPVSTDLTVATYSWMACYEKPGNGSIAHLDTRISYAQEYLDKMNSSGSGGQDYASSSATQKAIADAAGRIGSPGSGLCAMWVSQVYNAAGCGYPSGNANNMYDAYCTSSDRNQLKVGMMIAVSTHSHTASGLTYGHIGIYVGDGKVMDNIGYIRTISVDDWINYYSTTVPAKWGFPPGV